MVQKPCEESPPKIPAVSGMLSMYVNHINIWFLTFDVHLKVIERVYNYLLLIISYSRSVRLGFCINDWPSATSISETRVVLGSREG